MLKEISRQKSELARFFMEIITEILRKCCFFNDSFAVIHEILRFFWGRVCYTTIDGGKT